MADTSAILALVDAGDRHHHAVLDLYERDPRAWLLPSAILPEVDYLLARRIGNRAAVAFMRDVHDGLFPIDWHGAVDLERVLQLILQYGTMEIGFVDASVMATAERLRAAAIVTLDLRHFGAVRLKGDPALLPRDA